MKRFVIVAIATCVIAPGALAGPLDGQDIPADFAQSKLIGLQTNHTGFGDATDLDVVQVFTEGNELDALYLAKDADYLYAGLTGNLQQNGHAFVIFIDVDHPFFLGQQELRVEGVDGAPAVLQAASREIVIDTNGTPGVPGDDTWSYGADGTLLPCEADVALVVDVSGGTMSISEYKLYHPSIGSLGTFDPTPGNPGDPEAEIYALRTFVGQSPINDHNAVLENHLDPDYGPAGFDDSNTTGVTDTSGANAADAAKGLEIGIPRSLFQGQANLNIFVATIDGADSTGLFTNQVLPPATSGFCDPPVTLPFRGDLTTITACQVVNLNNVPAFTGTAEGLIAAAEYGGAPVTLQTCPTPYGDQHREPDILASSGGSELNALWADNDDQYLYLGITGNLASDGTSINIFVDADAQDEGQHVLDYSPASAFETIPVEDFNSFTLGGSYASWATATFTPGPTEFRVQATGGFGGGYFAVTPNVNLTRGTTVAIDVTLNPGSSAGGVIVVLADGDDTQLRWSWYGLSPGTYNLTASYASGVLANAGTVPGFDAAHVSFAHIQGDFATTDITFQNLGVVSLVAGAAAVVGMSGDELPNGPLDTLNNALLIPDAAVHYDYAYGINVAYSPHLAYVDFFDLINEAYAFRGAVVPESGDPTLFDNPGGAVAQNPNGLEMGFNNWNTNGVLGCDSALPCFLDGAATVAALAEQATTGVELAVPLADLGLDASDLPRIIRLWTMVGTGQGSASNQSLPSMRNASGEGNQVVNPGPAPVNFTHPEGGPSLNAVLSDFSNFALDGTYGTWATAVFTSTANDFRVQSTDFGGGYFFLNPNVDASGATEIVLDVTLNPANQTDKVVVVLFDADGTTRVFRFENLVNGAHTLTMSLDDYVSEDNPGTVPGLDLSALSQFNIAGAFHHGNPGFTMDVTFDNLALAGEARNFEARAARICLGTVAGDADCDGDNDLLDFAMLQQCIGIEASPVLPLECEQLDFVKDRAIDDQDVVGFIDVLDGP